MLLCKRIIVRCVALIAMILLPFSSDINAYETPFAMNEPAEQSQNKPRVLMPSLKAGEIFYNWFDKATTDLDMVIIDPSGKATPLEAFEFVADSYIMYFDTNGDGMIQEHEYVSKKFNDLPADEKNAEGKQRLKGSFLYLSRFDGKDGEGWINATTQEVTCWLFGVDSCNDADEANGIITPKERSLAKTYMKYFNVKENEPVRTYQVRANGVAAYEILYGD